MELLRMNEVIRMTGYSWDSIWRNEKKGLFPKKIKIDKRHVRWNKQEIEDWIRQKGIKRPIYSCISDVSF